MRTQNISIKGRVFSALVAETPTEQQTGLMWREWPPPPMIFPYKNASMIKFWMKNTISPLDIIFCKAGKVVGVFAGQPLSTTLVGPNETSDLVIELPAGTAGSIGLQIGDYVGIEK
jgi:uncharacterized membrane protein (UPF0127 family)